MHQWRFIIIIIIRTLVVHLPTAAVVVVDGGRPHGKVDGGRLGATAVAQVVRGVGRRAAHVPQQDPVAADGVAAEEEDPPDPAQFVQVLQQEANDAHAGDHLRKDGLDRLGVHERQPDHVQRERRGGGAVKDLVPEGVLDGGSRVRVEQQRQAQQKQSQQRHGNGQIVDVVDPVVFRKDAFDGRRAAQPQQEDVARQRRHGGN